MHSAHDAFRMPHGAPAPRRQSSGVPPDDRIADRSAKPRRLAAIVAVLLLALGACASPAAPPPNGCAGADVADLPLVAVVPPARPASPPRVAIILSGDGGWRAIDKALAETLVQHGIPVVGFNTPLYFLERKSPDAAACALARVMRRAMIDRRAARVLLIGYSRGADVLPFMASRLPADLARSVDVIALLGAEKTIEFRYDPLWYPFKEKEPVYDVLPEVQKLRGQKLLCVYGEDEDDSLCRVLDPQLATRIVEPGGHHFGGNYDQIADAIVANIPR